ncbi:hypothetical protein JTB14_024015 [Gonioctena quinquepunctata]|nr:hypothetical protein JTB14_024015 [Gonioctena quinquepunctata]
MDPFPPNHEPGPASETPVIPDEHSDVQVSKKRKGNAVEKKLLEAMDTYNIRQKGKSQFEKVGASEDDDKLFLLPLSSPLSKHNYHRIVNITIKLPATNLEHNKATIQITIFAKNHNLGLLGFNLERPEGSIWAKVSRFTHKNLNLCLLRFSRRVLSP